MRNFKIIQKIWGALTTLFTTRRGIVKLLISLLLLVMIAAGAAHFCPHSQDEDEQYLLDEASQAQFDDFMTVWRSKHSIPLKSEKYINITINNGSDYQIIKELSPIVESGRYLGSQPKINITIIDRGKFLIAIVRATCDENDIQSETVDIMTYNKKKDAKWCFWQSEGVASGFSHDSSPAFQPAAAARPVGAGR